jgi:hypothetical protein
MIFIQRRPKVTSLAARSSRGRCAEHLRRIRGCDARFRRESGVNLAHVTQMLRAKFAYDARHAARVIMQMLRAPAVQLVISTPTSCQ